MFKLIKKILVMKLLSGVNSLNTIPLKNISMKNQECKVREVI